jgi:hypothetical protein
MLCQMRFLWILPLLGAIAAPASAADPAIAGRGATLEQAASQTHSGSYRLLIRGKELQRVKASEAEQDVRALLERVRSSGGVLFACEKDLKKQHLRPADLLPGILSVDASDVWENGAPSDADRKLRSICS